MKNLDRRNFIRKTTLATAAIGIGTRFVADCQCPHVTANIPTIHGRIRRAKTRDGPSRLHWRRFTGRRVTSNFLAALPGTEIVAISDLYEDNVKQMGEPLPLKSGQVSAIKT